MAGRSSIWLIVAAALVPVLLFAIFQVGFAAREQRRAVETRALNLSRELIIRADGETARIATVLDALATSTAVRRGDWRVLRERFTELAALHPDLEGLSVRDAATGRLLLSVGIDPAQSVRIADGRAATRPLFVGYARAPTCRCLMFKRSSATVEGRRITLDLLTDSTTFLRMLPPPSGQYAVSAFNGPKARFIARSVDHDQRFGTMSSTYLQAAVASGHGGGLYQGVTLEQVENYTAYARSAQTGWTAHVALGTRDIDDPTLRFLASIGFAALLSLLLAALLIGVAVRQMRGARAFGERVQQSQKLEALGQLTGGLAHDFNNLLTPVIATLDQLSRRDTLDTRGQRLAAGALASAQRAAKLTSQLLAFSRRQKLSIATISVPRLVAEVSELIERTLGARHPFEARIAPGVGCIASDVNQLEVALLNLAINARDASPEGSPITLDVRSGGNGDVLFEMRDSGCGMDEKTRLRALEPFFTTKQTGQGTGLGLAQVYGVVAQSGGSMTIDSTPGRGTTVRLRLPACEDEETAEVVAAAQPDSWRLLRLLVVDDDPAVRATITCMLIEEGHAVESVASGPSALAVLRTTAVDLVIADYLMPGMTGAELIQAAGEIRPGTRFLLVSGYSDSEDIAAVSGDTDLLRKPFTAEELRLAIVRAVGVRPPDAGPATADPASRP